DWSSDVCASDLNGQDVIRVGRSQVQPEKAAVELVGAQDVEPADEDRKLDEHRQAAREGIVIVLLVEGQPPPLQLLRAVLVLLLEFLQFGLEALHDRSEEHTSELQSRENLV